MSKWINCLLQYCKDGKVGACPVCGSTNVQIQKHRDGNRGSVTLQCGNCKATDHFDGFLDQNVGEKNYAKDIPGKIVLDEIEKIL